MRVSLNTYARGNGLRVNARKVKAGVPCGNYTHLRGFADHCLSYSANGTKIKVRADALVPRSRCWLFGLLEPEIIYWSVVMFRPWPRGERPFPPLRSTDSPRVQGFCRKRWRGNRPLSHFPR